jgi:phospholipase C
MVISPYAKQNYVDHTVTDQTSTLRFIEDNWLGGQRIAGSFDSLAGRLNSFFDWKNPDASPLILDTNTGLVQK